MNKTATKVVAGLILFASGLVTGVFGARYLAERGRLALFRGDPRFFSEMVVRHMSDDLDLTRAQREKVRAIVLDTADQLAKIRREQEPRVRKVIEASVVKTKAILTPEQLEKFTALTERLEKRRKAMERFGPPPPGGPPGLGPPPPGPGGGLGGFPPPPPPPGDFGRPPPHFGPPPRFGPVPPPSGDQERDAAPDRTPDKTSPAPPAAEKPADK